MMQWPDISKKLLETTRHLKYGRGGLGRRLAVKIFNARHRDATRRRLTNCSENNGHRDGKLMMCPHNMEGSIVIRLGASKAVASGLATVARL